MSGQAEQCGVVLSVGWGADISEDEETGGLGGKYWEKK